MKKEHDALFDHQEKLGWGSWNLHVQKPCEMVTIIKEGNWLRCSEKADWMQFIVCAVPIAMMCNCPFFTSSNFFAYACMCLCLRYCEFYTM